MKTYKYLFIVLTVFTFSCTTNSNKDNKNANKVNSYDNETQFTQLTNSEIGLIVNKKIQINVTEKNIKAAYTNYVNRYFTKENLSMINYSIKEIDGFHYLRFNNEDGSVISLGLYRLDNSLKLFTGKITCKTSDYSNNDGCVPEGKHCTNCTKEVAGEEVEGDCSKVATSNNKDLTLTQF